MKCTLNINLAGIAFVIDNDAYNFLKLYLENVEKCIGDISDKKEILLDIESRLAEIFISQGADKVRVVAIDNVKKAIEVVGEPEVFGNGSTSYYKSKSEVYSRRLMRDTKDCVISGVCSGVALYSGVNTSLIRAFVIFFAIFGGTSIPLYIIGWIFIPKARTISEMSLMDKMRDAR
ncbi:MAG: PspC domain-containing protein [Bacteroidetes bacterium]|nr:PspC domain-containing protein [Bacteroidota bacterium]